MKKIIITIICLIAIPVLFAQEEDTTTVTETTDIHYTGKYCTECHEKTPVEGGDKFLKFGGDFTQLCRCHGYTAGTYIHPVDIEPSEEKKPKIPDDLPLQDGKITCSTCHDIYMQCQYNPRLKQLNKNFLRGAPYVSRTTMCFRCHDEKKYKMLDPHTQLTAKGDIIVEKCLYCHVEKPDVERASSIKDIKLIGGFEVLCSRCHFEQSQLHPINANHLRKPTVKTLEMMKEAERRFGIILPLNYEGKVTCITCHNPHERGVIPAYKAAAKGASEEYRLRLPGKTEQICLACHKDKKVVKK
jgi:hypothetical protein